MRPFVPAQVDAVARARDPREQSLDDVLVLSDEGEDRAVVIDVGVDVEELRPAGERLCEGVDRRLLPTLREVRNRFEREGHARNSRRAGGISFKGFAAGRHLEQQWKLREGSNMADIDTFSERLVDMAERFADMTDAAQGRGHRQGGIRARWVVVPAAAAGIYLLGASGSLRRQAGSVAKQAKDRAT